MESYRLFILLLWKNWVLQLRTKVLSVFQVVLPVVLIGALAVLNTFVSYETDSGFQYAELLNGTRHSLGTDPEIFQYNVPDVPESTEFPIDFGSLLNKNRQPVEESKSGLNDTSLDEKMKEKYLEIILSVVSSPQTMAYTPDVPAVQRVINRAIGSLANLSFAIGLENEVGMARFLRNTTNLLAVGISFKDQISPDGRLVDHVAYTIRPNGLESIPFISVLQYRLDEAIIQELSPDAANVSSMEMFVQKWPEAPQKGLVRGIFIKDMLSVFLLCCTALIVIFTTKDIVLEKELKLKETMKMMGLPGWLHWSAWFTKYFIMLLFVTIFVTIILTWVGRGLLQYTDGFLFFIFLLLYGVASIAFAMAVSTFFNKANNGSAGCAVLLFLTFIPAWVSRENPLPSPTCLLHNYAMYRGLGTISVFEYAEEPLVWTSLNQRMPHEDHLTMLEIWGFLLLDTVLYLLITWYIDNVYPGKFGIPKPFYFPFTKWYWLEGDPKDPKIIDEDMTCLQRDPEMFEETPSNTNIGISIQNLRKVFRRRGQTINAVAGMAMDMYDGHITALLGHNGAGKTTTLHMITGFLRPTSGDVLVGGHSIMKDTDKIRRGLGLCPQENVLFETLTVEEHLQFFGRLKGMKKEELEKEITDMLTTFTLLDKRKTISKKLSGGMKRKLCVCIALIGGSKVLILDEPTAGMDPKARRQTWDILQTHREGRTMVLTTHYMDEADYLGDRIAIMASGVVNCCGSSLFLKSKFGVGYHMVMVKKPECDVLKVDEIIKRFVPEAQQEINANVELSYILPQESTGQFEAMFNTLDENKDTLGISSYGASVTTMEEVFLRAGEKEFKQKTQKDETRVTVTSKEDGDTSTSVFGSKRERHTGIRLYFQQYRAMFTKKLLHTWRNKGLSLAQVIVPLVFVLLTCVLWMFREKLFTRDHDAQQEVSLSQYKHQIVPFVTTSKDPGSVDSQYAAEYRHIVSSQGAEAKFLDDTPDFKSDADLTRYMADVFRRSTESYDKQHNVGALFDANRSEVTAFYKKSNPYRTHNLNIYANQQLSINLIENARLRKIAGPTKSITMYLKQVSKFKQLEGAARNFVIRQAAAPALVNLMLLALTFLIAPFIIPVIKEREIGAKHLQSVSGVHTINLWAANFAWDILHYMIIAVVLVIVCVVFQVELWTGRGREGMVILLLLAFGWSAIPAIYLFSFVFRSAASAFSWVIALTILFGIPTFGATYIADLVNEQVYQIMDGVFLCLFPNYNVIKGLYNLAINMNESTGLAQYDHPGVGRILFAMFCQGLVAFALLFLLETGVMRRCYHQWLAYVNTTPNNIGGAGAMPLRRTSSVKEDADVIQERLRIREFDLSQMKQNEALVLKNLKKMYGQLPAVNGLSVGIPQGECFGLLGMNGAGKTTTFKMLTGDETISSGNAYVGSLDVKYNVKQVQQQLGYCPQLNALLDHMTVRETLVMYGRLRGMAEEDIPEVVEKLIKSLLLNDHVEKLAMDLSGGNKRKLSTAVSLIGDPPIVCLDEPSAGIDPVARRHLWDTLLRVRDSGRTLILTSHSMEECEALCNRLAIMVNGVFKCLGVPQHLKTKFGKGYTLMAKIQMPDDCSDPEAAVQPFIDYIQTSFPGSIVKDLYHTLVHFQIPSKGLSWAAVFGAMEREKSRLHVIDYSVSQVTLEQVFLNLVRSQIPPEQRKLAFKTRLRNCCRYCCCCKCFRCRENCAKGKEVDAIDV